MSRRWTQGDVNKLLDRNPQLVPGKKTSLIVKAKYRYFIGIDCGVKTGIGIWDRKEKAFSYISTVMIHQAMRTTEEWKRLFVDAGIFVRVEDARLRTWVPKEKTEKGERGRREGAGSVKRDARIWEDFLTELGLDFEMVAPKNNTTKVSVEYFHRVTGYDKLTSKHARDAGMLVCGF